MDRIELVASTREVEKGAAKRLREQGRVPGMLYGHGVGNVPLQFAALELRRTLTTAGASQLIHLRIDDSPTTQPVLAREIQRDVLNGNPIHVDLLAVSMTEMITAEVVINLVGEPRAVSAGDGMLMQGANSIEIECLPGDLIPSIEVDVTDLELDDSILISDIKMPENIAVLSSPDEMVAQIVRERMEAAVEEGEEALFGEEEPAEPVVIGRGRIEEEEED